jgi:hypothetical protein
LLLADSWLWRNPNRSLLPLSLIGSPQACENPLDPHCGENSLGLKNYPGASDFFSWGDVQKL